MNFGNQFSNSPPAQEKKESGLEKSIEVLEQINCNLDTKATMVVVALGIKPSATINIYKHEEDLDLIKSKMHGAGLFFDDIEIAPFRNENVAAVLTIAKSQAEATHLADLFKSERSDEVELELGKSLGYPPSTTEAYIGKRERYEHGLYPFIERRIPDNLQFMLSKDNWEQELGTAIEWFKALKTASPELYKKIIETQSSEYENVPFVEV